MHESGGKFVPRIIRPYPVNKPKIVRSQGGLNKRGLLHFKVQAHKQKEHLNLRFSSTRQGKNYECHPENSFLFIIWAAIRFCFINQPWALYIACDKCFNICDLVAVKSLYITWLIHKEQFTYQVHQLGISTILGFWRTLGGCMGCSVVLWRFFSLEKGEVFSLSSGCFPSKCRFSFGSFIAEHLVA